MASWQNANKRLPPIEKVRCSVPDCRLLSFSGPCNRPMLSAGFFAIFKLLSYTIWQCSGLPGLLAGSKMDKFGNSPFQRRFSFPLIPTVPRSLICCHFLTVLISCEVHIQHRCSILRLNASLPVVQQKAVAN